MSRKRVNVRTRVKKVSRSQISGRTPSRSQISGRTPPRSQIKGRTPEN